MEKRITSKEELTKLGEPFAKLQEIKGFSALSDIQEMLLPLKNLVTESGFGEIDKSTTSIE